jgi:hypothetical protein
MKFKTDPDTCSCCEGVEILTPLSTYNRPGLPALAYRIGTHGDFLESMLARLSSLAVEVDENGVPLAWQAGQPDCEPRSRTRPGDPCAPTDRPRHYLLRALTTRLHDDPAIALLDAWAVVADVLTFYQERIANEGYLRTALERRSVQELARLVGYKLRPGVASSVYLAFELDRGYQVRIPAGTRAQSVPQPGDLPQPFETSTDLNARYAWNAIPARRQRPQYIALHNVYATERLYLEGLSTMLKPNDPLLFVFGAGQGEQAARFVQATETVTVIEPVPGAGYTIVDLQPLEAVVEAQRLATHYLDAEQFDTVLDTHTAAALLPHLQVLVQARSLKVIAQNVQAALRLLAQPVHPNAGPPLRSWLQNLESDLLALSALLAPPASSQQQARSPFPFLAQAAAQVKEPARRFASGSDLPRDLAQILSRGGGAIPELITALNPRLAKTFYPAWGSAQTTPDPSLQRVAALRVKAAPWGHNAAPMPILDDQGALVGETEWPLEGATTIQVILPVVPGGVGPVFFHGLAIAPIHQRARITIKAGGQTYRHVLDITEGATLTLPIGQVEVEEATENSTHIRFIVDGLERFIQFDRNGDQVDVTVNDKPPLTTLAEGETITLDLGTGHRVTAFYSSSGVGVTDETLLPVARRNELYLDAAYDQILPSSYLVLDRPGWPQPRAFQVERVDTVAKTDYKLSGQSTHLVLSDDWLTDQDLLLSDIRSTTVYARSEALKQVDERYDDEVGGTAIELDGLYDGLELGRWVFVSGERVDIPGASGVQGAELAMIANVTQGVQQVIDADGNQLDRPGDKAHTTLKLAQPLDFRYARQTVKVYANVALATHGETRREIVGSGDARKAFQKFTLRQAPLTYVPASTPSGAASTLEVRVSDVRWPEVERLHALDGDERGYELRRDNDGTKDLTTIRFGDGVHGARLPTGPENVEALYRSGIGKLGNVPAETIKMLITRPLGVKAVNNPERASGGADRDDRDAARRNAPLAVQALDRLVSAQDYADFCRMFAGVGKAAAQVFPQRRGKLVHVTIAGADDIPIDVNSSLYRNLNLALRRYGDPSQPFEVDVRELLLLIVSARVRVLPDYRWESVEPQIRGALLETFGFERRELGQDVYAAELIAAIQRTPGVAYVDLDFLGNLSEADSLDPVKLQQILPNPLPPRPVEGIDIWFARRGAGTDILPAQLALLSPEIPETLVLTELT